MFTFCPLQGALSESSASQSLLELDGGVKILVGLGWDESFDPEKLRELEKQVPTLSLVLLTHATTEHLAAYAHCCKNFPLFTRVPVYGTRPVIDLGRTLTQDLYASSPAAATVIPQSSLSETAYAYSQTVAAAQNLLLQPPSPEEIARYFSLIQPLKYSQPHQPLPSPFSPPLNGLTITAYNSGHTLGGTIWHIQHGLESIVYAIDWNQARENVFAGAAWLGGAGGDGAQVIEQLRKPTALVCSSRGADKNAPTGGRAKRDECLVETIKACVGKGGTVLIPVDSSARVLEMAYLLEHVWRADASRGGGTLKSAKLYLAGRNMSSTMRLARSMLEWMDDSIVQEFEASAEGQRRVNGTNDRKEGGPLDFRYLRVLERKAQIARLLRLGRAANATGEGHVILASDESMDWGFSQQLVKGLATDPRNLVILTQRPSAAEGARPSIARTLWTWWAERRDGVSVEQTGSGDNLELVYGGGRELEVRDAHRQALEGDELVLYQQWLATQRQLQATQQAGGAGGLESTADVVDDASSESSSASEDEDGEQQGKALNVSATIGQASRRNVVLKEEDLGINVLTKKKGVYDFDSRGKKGRERCFPMPIRRRRNDDFGEMIRPEDYLRAEEKEEEQADGGIEAAEDEKLGKKRKWDDAAGARGMARRSRPTRASSAEAGDGGGGAADELDAVVGAEDAGDEEDEDKSEAEKARGPSKLAYTSERVAVNLRIAFIDFSGLHDKRSLNMLIPLIQPRKLILVAGTREETMSLAGDCRAALGTESDKVVDVYTPETGASVDASVDTNAWVVRLGNSLVKTIKWQKVRGLGIVTVSGQLIARDAPTVAAGAQQALLEAGGAEDEEASPNKRQKMEHAAAASSTAVALTSAPSSWSASPLPTLEVAPPTRVLAARAPLHVGDLRLADLRRAMQGSGHAAEFRGEGTLVIDGTVAVRKTAEGRVEVESVEVPGVGRRNTMYEVKRVIYDNLAVVAGG